MAFNSSIIICILLCLSIYSVQADYSNPSYQPPQVHSTSAYGLTNNYNNPSNYNMGQMNSMGSNYQQPVHSTYQQSSYQPLYQQNLRYPSYGQHYMRNY